MTKPLLTQYTKKQIAGALSFDRRSFYTAYKLDKKDQEILAKINQTYADDDDTIGAKKLAKILGIGKNRCQRVMTKNGIKARKKHDGYVYPGKADAVFDNLLISQDITKYVDVLFSDMFEFRLVDTTEIHGCFLFKHRTEQVVSLLLDYCEDATLVKKTLDEATLHIKPGSIFHVDQGKPNGAQITIQKVRDLHMLISMSRAGTPTDNPFAERFVKTFKLAVVYKRPYFTLGEALEASLKWINFYNDKRPHETINMMTPNEYAISIGEKPVSIERVFRV